MVSENRTAFLVIHGVGPHTHFQACDSFIQGFCDEYLKGKLTKTQPIDLQHNIKPRRNWLGTGISWLQNYVSLSVPDDNVTVDFYEYYWDIYMTHKAPFSEAYKLLTSASVDARKFYEQHPDMVPVATDLGEYFRKKKFMGRKREFKPAGYLKLLGPSFKLLSFVLPFFPPLLWILDKWAGTRLPIIGKVFEGFSAFMREPVPHFIGDVVRYLDLDPRSENFETRRKITNGAVEELRELINDESYTQIIIAGHSLGSVIAHNALNRIIHDVNANVITEAKASKIKGLITFGSPLDKVAFFFRRHIDIRKDVQRQVLAHLHGFKARPLDVRKPDDKKALIFKVEDPIKRKMDTIRWLNFYHKKDLISGRLDLYNLENQNFKNLPALKGDGNIRIKDSEKKISVMTAHGCYWGNYQGTGKGTNQMHQAIIKEFIQ
ncbi:hypothetical protein ACFLWI_02235 [Chloroflexota bacterium]